MLEVEIVVTRFLSFRLCQLAVLGLLFFGGSLASPLPAALAGERILPLGPAEVSSAVGDVSAGRSDRELHAVQKGVRLTTEPWVKTGPGAHAELRFADGTLIRLGERTRITLFPTERRVWLAQGKVLVVSDRMAGGLAVLSELAALLPEGTSYLAEAVAKPDGKSLASVTVTVIEGAVCACSIAANVPSQAAATRDAMVLPGETMTIVDLWKRPAPKAVSLLQIVSSEKLWMGFETPLPELRWVKENLDQQRRGILGSRNTRLRREIFWKRPPHPPVPPPTQFIEPAKPPQVRYEFPG